MISQGSALDLALFNISLNILDDRMDTIPVITIADTRLPRRLHTLEDRIKMQANIGKLEKWSGKNEMQKSKLKQE